MQAIRFLAPGATIDTEFVTLVVRSLEISRRRPLQAFRHYDANQFRSFERALQPEMRAAGLEAIC